MTAPLLVDITNLQFDIRGGAQVTFPSVTGYAWEICSSSTLFLIDGAGTALGLPGLQHFNIGAPSCGATPSVNVTNGGHLDLGGLTSITTESVNSLSIALFAGGTMDRSSAEASKVRERLNAGETFENILNEYLAKDIRYGIESVIENNPSLERFKGFWQEASGAAMGDVLGPTYMPDYGRVGKDANGQAVQETVPECWIVFKVLEAKPAEVLPFEQARPYVSGPVAFTAMMDKLWEEKGAEIFEDKIPEPRGGDKDIFAN